MRQIVAGLTGDSDGTGDLAVELSRTDPASLETGQDSEDDSGEPEDWVPDPVDADPGLRPPPQALGQGASSRAGRLSQHCCRMCPGACVSQRPLP